MENFKSFTSIQNFKQMLATAKYKGLEGEKLNFTGTVKLHGTNSSILKFVDSDTLQFQSRNNILGPSKDNLDFYTSNSKYQKEFLELFKHIETIQKAEHYTAIYGEWCGKKIQSRVALSEIERFFVIFAVKIDDVYLDISAFKTIQNGDIRVYNILDFPVYNVVVDVDNPDSAIKEIQEFTQQVEKECPVGKFFGKSGTGEGIVWRLDDCPGNVHFWFKSKGELHSMSKKKECNYDDSIEFKNARDFVDNYLTTARLNQGFDWMIEQNIPINLQHIKDYILWEIRDLEKEEKSSLKFGKFDVKKLVSKQAGTFYRQNFNKY